MTWREMVVEQLTKHEGVKRFPYTDTVGKLTIGVGRNLTDKGLRPEEIAILLDHDVADAEDDARALVGNACFNALSDVRKAVVVNMAFNLGVTRLRKFVQMLAAMKDGRHRDVAMEMRQSKWAQDVKGRAEELATLYERG